jgi:hypothetical protein
MSEMNQRSTVQPADVLSSPAPSFGASIKVRHTSDGRAWATAKGYLGVGWSESEALEKLARVMAVAVPATAAKPDTASRPLSVRPPAS